MYYLYIFPNNVFVSSAVYLVNTHYIPTQQ